MPTNPAEWIRHRVAEHQDLVARFFRDHGDLVIEIADRMSETLRGGGKILLFGNGGSAADAQHLAAELVGALGRDRDGLAAVALTTDTSVLTSLANDFEFASIFARQIRALGRTGDTAIGITTSGRSPNVVEGLREARRLGLRTVALLGRDGGTALPFADIAGIVPGEDTQRIQEVHLMIGHLLCELVIERCRPAARGKS